MKTKIRIYQLAKPGSKFPVIIRGREVVAVGRSVPHWQTAMKQGREMIKAVQHANEPNALRTKIR